MKKTFLLVIGTRPEVIKTFPLIKHLKKKYNLKIIWTGQHFSKVMSDDILKSLNFPNPDYKLKKLPFNHGEQIAKMVGDISKIIQKEKPVGLLVQGDTNSTLAGAIASIKCGVKLIHVEAGARCFNKAEPEELNRIMVDNMSTINFTFSAESTKHLIDEKIKSKCFNFPNTVYETCHFISPKIKKIKLPYPLEKNKYLLVTLHRKSNLKDKRVFDFINLLNDLSNVYQIPIVFPIHPMTEKLLKKSKIVVSPLIKIIPPQDYQQFIKLLSEAKFIISDSGGVVDESYYFNKPLFIYREETERIDIIKLQGATLLNPDDSCLKKLNSIKKFLNNHKTAKNKNYVFCHKMVSIINKELSQ